MLLLLHPVAVLQESAGGWAVETVGGTLSGDKEANLTSPSDACIGVYTFLVFIYHRLCLCFKSEYVLNK